MLNESDSRKQSLAPDSSTMQGTPDFTISPVAPDRSPISSIRCTCSGQPTNRPILAV